jgi:LacI family transcriptional regulator
MKPITLKDIASALNTSVATVSRALSNSSEISEDTKQRVVEYAKTHNYRYNTVAKMLKTGRSKNIVLIVPSLDNRFLSKLLSLLERQIALIGYHLIVMQSHSSPYIELECLESCYYKGIDGLVILSMGSGAVKSRLELMVQEGMAIVDINELYGSMVSSFVEADWRSELEDRITTLSKDISRHIVEQLN